MAICTTSSKLKSMEAPLYFFSSQLTASWSLAPAPVACARRNARIGIQKRSDLSYDLASSDGSRTSSLPDNPGPPPQP